MLKRFLILLLALAYNSPSIAVEDDNPCVTHDWEMVQHDCSLILAVTPYKSVVLPANGSVSLVGLSRSCCSARVDGKCYYECTKCSEKKEETCGLETDHHISPSQAWSPGTYTGNITIWCSNAPNDTRSGSATIEVLEKCPKCDQSPCQCCKLCRSYPCICCTVCNRPPWDCYCCSECKKPKDQCICLCRGCNNAKSECTCGIQDPPPEEPPEPEGPAEDEIEDDGSGGSAHPHNYKADEVRCKISSLNSDVVHYYTGPEDVNQLRRFLISCPIVVDDCTVIYRCSKDGCNASRRKYPYHQNKKEDGTPIPDSGLVVEPCPICSENLADAFTTDGVSTFCMKVKCSCPKNTDYAYIKVKVAIPRIDLDIDSDNNNGLGMPDRSQAEELEEEKKDTVGKLVLLNDFDTDGDGIPDFADGYDNINLEPEANQRGDNVSADFVPVVVSISSGLDPAKTKVRFSYPACDPAIVFKRTVDGVMDFLLPPEGNIRLWTKNGSTARAKESIVKDSSPGDYIPPDVDIPFEKLNPNGNVAVIYLEAVQSFGDETNKDQISVAFSDYKDVPADSVFYSVLRLRMGIDGNRDQVIDLYNPADRSALFWPNDDRDTRAFSKDGYVEDDLDGSERDCDDDTIGTSKACIRDLEDFTKLHIEIDRNDSIYKNPDLSLLVKSSGVTVNLFKAVCDDFSYISQKAVAENQIKAKKLLTVSGTEQEIPLEQFKKNLLPFLLEGCSTGDGQISAFIKYKGNVIAERKIQLKLDPITNFYDFFSLNDIQQTISNVMSNARRATYQPSSNDYILYVHGWNMQPYEKTRWTETMFKRLWWQGYDGRVGAFAWPTLTEGAITTGGTYNDSEFRAWHSGKVLKDLFGQLGNHKLSVLAHSMGNVVTSEALKQYGGKINAYVSSQAAVPARCYEGAPASTSYINKHLDYYGEYPVDTPPKPYFYGLKGKASYLIRMMNAKDFALAMWEGNNALKPKVLGPYSYSEKDGVGYFYRRESLIPDQKVELTFPDNTYEIFAFILSAQTGTIGAEPAPIPWFININLAAAHLGKYDYRHYSHSRQFRSNLIDEFGYWRTIINECKLTLVP